MNVLDPPSPGAVVGGSPIQLPGGLTGSLGCLVSLDGADMILSSAHILTVDGVGSPGETVRQVGGGKIGEFSEVAEPLNFGGQNKLDVALAKVTSPTVSPWIGTWGPPTSTPGRITPGMRIWSWGSSNKGKSARVKNPGWSGLVSYGGRAVHFSGLVECEPYAKQGDSGAAVLDDDMNLVGVHVGGAGGQSVFCPIDAILAHWPTLKIIGK